MPKLKDLPIFDLTGGLITNRADNLMADNELKDSLNLDFNEQGRLKRRRGIRQFGDTKTGILDDSYLYVRRDISETITGHHIIVDRASNATAYEAVGTYTTLAITTATTTITVGSTTNFANSGSIEINGDLITYTGKTATTFTGCGAIRVAHATFSSVTQLVSLGQISIDTRSGVYFSILNDFLFINGTNGSTTWDGTDFAAVTDDNEASGLFATNYRDRIYVAGAAGSAGGTGKRNRTPIRVAYTDPGDSTDWGNFAVNFFDVEDDRGEIITGERELSDTLLIFKLNSMFAYDEIRLVQRLWNVGAYNHKVIQKIGNLVYIFCPSGVFVTNGVSAQKISDPVRKYTEAFKPTYDTTFKRVVENCFAGVLEGKYYLYLSDLEEPNSRNDVVLVYDTIKGNWTVYDSLTNITHFASLPGFWKGAYADSTAGAHTTQHGRFLFAGDTGGKYFRLFENRFLDNASTRGYRGGDIAPDMQSNDAGSAIQTVAETKWYNIGDEPTQWAKLDRISALTETGSFQISYRLDLGDHFTDWISLGEFKGTTTRKLKESRNTGYRIAFKITSNVRDILSVFNGLILKDRETIDKEKYGINR